MAKRTASRAIVRAVPAYRVSAPTVVYRTRRAPAKKRHHRRHSGAGGKVNQKVMMGAAIGGAVLGFVDKQFTSLPTIPLLGKAGTIAIAAWMLSGRGGIGGIARDVALAAAAVAGYEMATTGKVSGEIAPQIAGYAASQV